MNKVILMGRLTKAPEIKYLQDDNKTAMARYTLAMEDATFMRKAMKAGPVNWGELAGAISYYQAEFGHTLKSFTRFLKRLELTGKVCPNSAW